MTVASSATPQPKVRRGARAAVAPGLMVLRGVAVLFIILSHAVIPYMTEPPAGIAWPVREPGEIMTFDWIYLWSRASQPVFFVISGLLAAASIGRWGPRAFLRDRWRMLIRPLLVATFTVLPVCYLVWMLGWWRTGYITLDQMLEFRLATSDKRDLLGFGHLWYIEFLLVYTCVYGAWRLWRGERAARTPLPTPLLIAGVAAWLLAWAFYDPPMVTGFRNGFVPHGAFLAYNAGYFVLGTALWSARAGIAARLRLWLLLVVAAQGLSVAWLALRRHGAAPEAQTVFMTLFSLAGSVGWTCLGVAWKPRKDGPCAPLIRLARSSYWVYLVHLPVLGAAHVLVYDAPISAWSKVLAAAAAGLLIPFAAHDALQRRRSPRPA